MRGKDMRVAIYTLGCKVNQYETQAMEAELTGRGHALVPFDGAADAYVINTCTVTAVSDKKSRQMIRQARKRSPHAVVAVCGCYAQTDPEAVEALGVDLVMGTADRMGFLDALEALSARQKEALWRGFLQDGTQPMEFQWLWDAYREGAVGSLLEWELTLQLTLEALGFAVVNGAGRFTVTGPDGSARSFDLIRGGPAEKLFLKILFPLDKRE